MPPSMSVMHGLPLSAKATHTSWTCSAHAGTTTGPWQSLISAVCTFMSSQLLTSLSRMVHMFLSGPSLAREQSNHTCIGPDPLLLHNKTGLYGKLHSNEPLCSMQPRSSTHLVLGFIKIVTINSTFHHTLIPSNSPTSSPPRS